MAGLLSHKNGEIRYLHKGLGWGCSWQSGPGQGSGLSLGGGGAGTGKKREWRLYQRPPQKEAVPVVAEAPELLLSHKINVLLNELQ